MKLYYSELDYYSYNIYFSVLVCVQHESDKMKMKVIKTKLPEVSCHIIQIDYSDKSDEPEINKLGF